MRAFLLASVFSVMTGSALALDTPSPGQLDPHIRIVPYSQFNVVNLIGEIGRQTTITFDKDEQILRVVMGNAENDLWDGPPAEELKNQPLRNNLPLWPQQMTPTNMQVTTMLPDQSQRVYQFHLSARKPDTAGGDDPDAVFGLIFTYPEQQHAKAVAEAAAAAKARWTGRQESIAKARLTVDPFYGIQNWAYIARPNQTWRNAGWPKPEVGDNGQITSFVFQGNVARPAIFIVDSSDPADRTRCLPGGEERKAPVSESGNLTIVQTTAIHFRLRLNEAVMEVCNLRYDPVGQPPGTGTTSPDVVREVRAVR
jgi:type IV secretion system protein VirB9